MVMAKRAAAATRCFDACLHLATPHGFKSLSYVDTRCDWVGERMRDRRGVDGRGRRCVPTWTMAFGGSVWDVSPETQPPLTPRVCRCVASAGAVVESQFDWGLGQRGGGELPARDLNGGD